MKTGAVSISEVAPGMTGLALKPMGTYRSAAVIMVQPVQQSVAERRDGTRDHSTRQGPENVREKQSRNTENVPSVKR